jgi:exopolysaccharide biosynthesis polyprenyl glycosylphosphotransferase
LERCLSEHSVDEVIVCLESSSQHIDAANILHVCQDFGVIVRFPDALFDLVHTSATTEAFRGTMITTFFPRTSDEVSLAVKRSIDMVVSAVLLLVLSPLFLVVAILIRVTSPGPVFFTKRMLGQNRRPFTIVKFRTMIPGADKMMDQLASRNEETGAGFKIRNDPRVTRIGRFLRRTSIDELPQLWNVLRGEMSLVGPRPLCQWEYDRIADVWVKRRFSVKPGLTGLWQVSGRSKIPFDGRIRLDLEYIDNWNLLLDCRLLLRTIPAVLTGRGAV